MLRETRCRRAQSKKRLIFFHYFVFIQCKTGERVTTVFAVCEEDDAMGGYRSVGKYLRWAATGGSVQAGTGANILGGCRVRIRIHSYGKIFNSTTPQCARVYYIYYTPQRFGESDESGKKIPDIV